MTRKIVSILIVLLCTYACYAQDFWDAHPPLCQTETYASVTQAVGVGVVAPTAFHYLSLRAFPEDNQNYRFMRLVGAHALTSLLAVRYMNDESLHDTDPAYTNILMLVPISLICNVALDLILHGDQQ